MSAPYVSKAALEHFDTWVDLSDGARAAWLAALKVSEPEVHARLLALIEADRVATRSPFAGMHKYVGEDSPNIVAVLSHLAENYAAVGRTADSERTIQEMRSAAERHAGNGHVAALLERAQATLEQIKAGRLPHCGA